MRAWLKIVRQTTGETHPLLLLLPQPLLHCFARQQHQLSCNTTFTQKPCERCDILNRCGSLYRTVECRYTRLGLRLGKYLCKGSFKLNLAALKPKYLEKKLISAADATSPGRTLEHKSQKPSTLTSAKCEK